MMHDVTHPRDDLSIEWIRATLEYDTTAGRLRRNGRLVGWLHPTGYRYYSVAKDGRKLSYKEHRIIWALVKGSWPTGQIDHINGDKSDNRIENLRDVTGGQNQRAIRHPNRNNTTGYRGVCFLPREGRFVAQIKIAGKSVRLGRFQTAIGASQAYEAKAASLRD